MVFSSSLTRSASLAFIASLIRFSASAVTDSLTLFSVSADTGSLASFPAGAAFAPHPQKHPASMAKQSPNANVLIRFVPSFIRNPSFLPRQKP
jgi:hypothetical protein